MSRRPGLAPWLLLALAGCAQPPAAPPPATRAVPETLERRLEDLAARVGPIAPVRVDAEEARAQLKSLEEEKARLLARLTPEHPSVVLIERRIQRLREHLPEPADPE